MAGKVIVTDGIVHHLDDEVVVRGILLTDSLRELQTPGYQREVLYGSKKFEDLELAHQGNGVPDVDLNMRGTRVREIADGSIELLDEVFIVDGLQRICSATSVMNAGKDIHPLGAYITIGKSTEWERVRFEILNNQRTQLSPNVNLRNQKEVIPAIATLYRLTHNVEFPLNRLVQWNQTMKSGERLTATVYVKTVARLHGQFGPGRGSNVFEVARGLDQIMMEVGRQALLANVKTFFGLIEECWGITTIDFKGATVLKQGFLMNLAQIFSDHPDFWDGKRLVIKSSVAKKLAQLSVNDPSFATASGSASGLGGQYVYQVLLQTVSKGRRTPLLTWAELDKANAGR